MQILSDTQQKVFHCSYRVALNTALVCLVSIFSFVFLFSCTLMVSLVAQAQTVTKQRLVAAYVINIAKNVEWPESSSDFVIGAFPSDDVVQLQELKNLQQTKIKGRAIQLKLIQNDADALKCNLILVDSNLQRSSQVLDLVQGKPVLVVTQEYPYQQTLMVNLLAAANNHIRFEVNKSNIINQGLKPLPEIILNGGTEIDVAKLYREGQISLTQLQKQLQQREKNLADLTQSIAVQEAKNAQLEKKTIELMQSIEKSDRMIADQLLQLERGRQEVSRLQQELQSRNEDIQKQRAISVELSETINLREAHLKTLDVTLKEKDAELIGKNTAISNLDQVVSTQKKALIYSWILVLGGVVLVAVIWLAYREKRNANLRLIEHAQDLQMARDRLALAKKKAEEASRAKGDFLSLMSHELRTPLQAIIGYTEVVIDDLKLSEDQTHVEDLSRVITNSERLLKLINGVLDLARMESGRMKLDLMEIKLSNLVDEACSVVSPLLTKNAISLIKQVEDGKYLPVADPEKLLHILVNLLGNACKFAPNGQVTLCAMHDNKQLYLSVADTGIGMSKEQQQEIFEPFGQANPSSARKIQGSGLGLSIAKQLCEMMGGSIHVESELGKGAKFIISIPLPIDGVANTPLPPLDLPENHDDPSVHSGMDIVMIDDDPSFLDIMARTMRQEGYRVFTASDAESGFTLVKKIKPQVITLDLLLPDQHGWTVFERIKSSPDIADIPIIIISMVDEPRASNKRKAEDYLTKPIRRETLRIAVQKLVPSQK